MKSFIVAGASSGSGKTTLALGLMEALRKRGFSVQPFKAGPDYIDGSLHKTLLKRPSYNLDTWMMGVEGVRRTFWRCSGSDISVIEGAMGLFDGRDGRSEEGSTAHLARVLGVPVLLVVNAEKMARSAGALVKGFTEFDRRCKVRWVVFNRVGSRRHFEALKDSVSGLKVSVLGCLQRDPALMLPERHLGLTQAFGLDTRLWRSFIKDAARAVEESVHIDGLLNGLSDKRLYAMEKPADGPASGIAGSVRIGVPLDAAFSFYYEENLDILRRSGAELVFFSPLKDRKLPSKLKGIYMGGGYPELYAEALEKNRALRGEIKERAEAGLPVYAECGGLMYLGRGIVGVSGKRHHMAGVFPMETEVSSKRRALGYREVEALSGCPFLPEGETIRGHEFRYSGLKTHADIHGRVFRVSSPSHGENFLEGYLRKNTLATYIHLHFASNPEFAKNFVRLCSGLGQD